MQTIKYFDDLDKLHRPDGPAIEWAAGHKEYWIHGLRSREDGPATEYTDAHGVLCKAWYWRGKLHRYCGPAIERSDGKNEWWVNGCVVRVHVKSLIKTKDAVTITIPVTFTEHDLNTIVNAALELDPHRISVRDLSRDSLASLAAELDASAPNFAIALATGNANTFHDNDWLKEWAADASYETNTSE